MITPAKKDVTQLLQAWSEGDPAALEKLVPLVYEELHRLASRYMRKEAVGQTLQATALLNEAYLRLVEQKDVRWHNRAHFFGIAAQLMRRILVDFARARRAQKRGGNALQVSLNDALKVSQEHGPDLVALDEALEGLAAVDPRKGRVVELRFFGGLTIQETAEVLKVSAETVLRDWAAAKAWLYREMKGDRS